MNNQTLKKFKIIILTTIFIFTSIHCMAQGAPKLGKIAILSFTGGSIDERDGIAELISITPQFMDNFIVIPRTTITRAISLEQNFQYSSGMTDADTMARLGHQFGADYVMAGSITSLGDSNILIVSVVKIDVIQQIAGDFIIYKSLNDLNTEIINKIANNLISTMKMTRSNIDRLAVLPVQFSGGVNEQEGDALAQLLSIFLIRNGKYSVYPRTKTLDQVRAEYSTQLSGITHDDEIVSLGRGINPPYVLSIASRRIGNNNRFNASVIDLERGNQIAGYTEPYTFLSDGIVAMEFLAKELSGIRVSDRERNRRSEDVTNYNNAEERKEAARARREKAARARDGFLKTSGFSFGVRGGMDVTATGANEASYSFGGEIGLNLTPYFGIYSGVDYLSLSDMILTTVDHGGGIKTFLNSVLQLKLLQVPLFLRGNILIKNDLLDEISPFDVSLNISPLAGVAFNFMLDPTDLNVVSGVRYTSYSPLSFLVGLEVGLNIWKFNVFIGYQYNQTISDNSYVIGGESYSDKKEISLLYAGLKFFLPFKW